MLGLQSRPYLQATEARGRARRRAARRGDDLPRARARVAAWTCSVRAAAQRAARSRDEACTACCTRARAAGDAAGGWFLSLLLRRTGQGGFKELLREPHGRLRPRITGRRLPRQARDHRRRPRRTSRRRALLAQARQLDADVRARAGAGRDAQAHHATARSRPTTRGRTTSKSSSTEGTRSRIISTCIRTTHGASGCVTARCADVASETATVRMPMRLLDGSHARNRRAAARLGPSARRWAVGREQDAEA